MPRWHHAEGAFLGGLPCIGIIEIPIHERFFVGWDATPEEQRVKFINVASHVIKHADYITQVQNNPDEQNSRLAMEKIIAQAIHAERKRELDLYKSYASDPDFKRAFDASIARLVKSGQIQLGA
ncbi:MULTISPECIES: hypothetical protein [Pseudomonas syringae group]|uniref:hypothetical protein n=1 Tax=Pseudomonas syringae group TaxID=136849 RepID=UPI00160535A9|nr:hypothetical protein [Pseudomonas syringae group genomosp. 3]